MLVWLGVQLTVVLGVGEAVPLLLPVVVGEAEELDVPLDVPVTLPLALPMVVMVADGVRVPLPVGEGLAVPLTLPVSEPLGLAVLDALAVSGVVWVLLPVHVGVVVGLGLPVALLLAGRALWVTRDSAQASGVEGIVQGICPLHSIREAQQHCKLLNVLNPENAGRSILQLAEYGGTSNSAQL